MRLSEFQLAIADEFGAEYGRVLTRDLGLGDLGGITADEAIKVGIPARDVWLALCGAMDVPSERRYGVGRREPKKP